MEHVSARLSRMSIVVLACVALVAAVAPGAAADGEIPRPPGAIDDRGWELVSTGDKQRNLVSVTSPPADDGNSALFQVLGPTPDAPGGSLATRLATRTESGWTTANVLPPLAEQPADTYEIAATSPDRASFIGSVWDGLIGNAGNALGEWLVRVDPGAQQSILYEFPSFWGASGVELVTSTDLRDVFARVSQNPDPSLLDEQVYEFGSGVPRLVSVMPTTGLPPDCRIPANGFAPPGGVRTQHWISTDGSKAFFATRGNSVDCLGPLRLYQRDLEAGTTTEITGDPVVGDPDNGIDAFLQGMRDGSTAFFRTTTSYDARDDADGGNADADIYRWTRAGGNVCITCAVPSATVSTGNKRAVVSENGAYVYFNSVEVLADAPPGTPVAAFNNPHLYVWHDDVVHYIGRTNGVGPRPQQDDGQTTPDGEVLLFSSSRPELDDPSGSRNQGWTQLYRYEHEDQSLTCVSCPQDGVPSRQLNTSLTSNGSSVKEQTRAITDDGSMVFFQTATTLVPEDVNNDFDIYEWHDGTVGLITSGTAKLPPNRIQYFVSVTPDGKDAMFVDPARLTSEAQDDAAKLYTARIGGGFLPPPTPPAPCAEEQCRPLPTLAPALDAVGSEFVRGSQNVTPDPTPAQFAVVRPSARQRARLVRTGRLALRVTVNRAGMVRAIAQAQLGRKLSVVARGSRRARGSGQVTVRLRLSRAARARLARTGGLTVVLGVRFSRASTVTRLILPLNATADRR
ncbi:MAG TPA: hypothetical protein VK506_00710 [Conexibacter sp.]|nr:hypothetical protein [Conexibacter sp.]